MKEQRPSVYLEEKCEGLEHVLDFFLKLGGSYMKPADEKLLVFLHQIDFWEWEIENLIFSFDNFKERSRAWADKGGIAGYLGARHGILVKTKAAEKVEFDRKCRAYRERYNDGGTEVIPPWEKLNKVIGKWNELLTLCEERVMVSEKTRNSAIHFGAQVLANLDKFRKKVQEQ